MQSGLLVEHELLFLRTGLCSQLEFRIIPLTALA